MPITIAPVAVPARIIRVTTEHDTTPYTVSAVYAQETWMWRADIHPCHQEWGDPPDFVATNPYEAIAAATGWLVAKSDNGYLPPAQLPSFTIMLDPS